MALANKKNMGFFKIKQLLTILSIILLLLSSCNHNNKHLSKKEYNRILDSLKQIEVPLEFDSTRFFQQRFNNVEIDSITPEGIMIWERREASLKFYREMKHKDSLFWDIYEYDCTGHLECYYRKYFNSCGDNPTGYVVFYTPEGEIDHFHEGLWEGQETGMNAKYSRYDVINKLKKDGIDLLKHNVYICYTKSTWKHDDENKHVKYYWMIGVLYYDDYETLQYQHIMRISPDTGEVLEDWIEKSKI